LSISRKEEGRKFSLSLKGSQKKTGDMKKKNIIGNGGNRFTHRIISNGGEGRKETDPIKGEAVFFWA